MTFSVFNSSSASADMGCSSSSPSSSSLNAIRANLASVVAFVYSKTLLRIQQRRFQVLLHLGSLKWILVQWTLLKQGKQEKIYKWDADFP